MSLVLALVAGACSSTTQREGSFAAGGTVAAEVPRGDGRDAPDEPGAAGPASPDSGEGAASTEAGGARSSRRGASTGPAPGQTSGPAGERPPAASQGVTDATISIGIPVLVNYDTVVTSFASEGQTVGDQRAQAQAVVDHLNANGGMAGRRIEPVYHEWDSGQGTFATQAQTTCARLAQDHRVFAVANHTYGIDTLVECLARANTPLVAGGDTGGWADQAMLDRYADYLYMPSWLNFTRWGVLVDGLVGQGFFEGSGKVGLLYLDEPMYRSGAEHAVKPALARHGIALAAEQAISSPEGTSGVADTSAEVANAVLRFRSLGVDRILFVEGVALIPFLFMPQAESQGYRPRYAIHSSDQASWIVNNAPAEQFTNARGMGWIVPNDVPLARDPGGNPTRETCLGIYEAARVEVMTDRFREHSALAICEHLLFLAAALASAPEVSPAGLRVGAEALGSSFRSALNFATSFGPGRHDGAAAVRPMAYQPACGCFDYVGPPIPLR